MPYVLRPRDLVSRPDNMDETVLSLTWTDCDKAGEYVVPNVLSPRDLVFRPDNMDETVLSSSFMSVFIFQRSPNTI